MSNFIIDGVDFSQIESEKYWSFPKSYKGNPKEEIKNMIFSGNYIGSRKIDGAYYRFIKSTTGEMRLQGRNKSVSGDFLDKIRHVPHLLPFFNSLPNGTCLLGELYFPDNEGSRNVTTIMGCKEEKAIQRQENGPKLHYYIFDVWAYNGKSMLSSIMEERVEQLNKFSMNYISDFVEYGKYYTGSQLWEQLQEILANGGEGVVITKANSSPAPGKRTARKTLKIKKELTENLDVFVIGANPPTKEYTGKNIETWTYWINLKNGEKVNEKKYEDYKMGLPYEPITKSFFYGFAGSLRLGVYRKGKSVEIGSVAGLSEDILSNWKDHVGKVMEISAMEVLPTMGLRHPKFIQFRPDLKKEDCTWEKIYGE